MHLSTMFAELSQKLSTENKDSYTQSFGEFLMDKKRLRPFFIHISPIPSITTAILKKNKFCYIVGRLIVENY